MNVFIETKRLYIRPLEAGDAAWMFAMDSDPEVHTFLGSNPLTRPEESSDVIAMIRKQYDDYGAGRWAVIEKSSGDFVGWTGHKFIEGPVNKHGKYYDFGYRLAKKNWGKGYATESGRAALHYGMDQLGFKDIYAITMVNNYASRNVLEKLGFQLEEIFIYDSAIFWSQQSGNSTTWYKWGS